MSFPRHYRSVSVPAAIDRAALWQFSDHDMADEQGRTQRGPPNYPYSFSVRRRSLPRRNTDARQYEPAVKYGSGNANKAQRRFSSAVNVPESILGVDDPAAITSTLGERGSDVQSSVIAPEDSASRNEPPARLSTPSIPPTSLASVAATSRRSNSDSEGGSTSTETIGKRNSRQKRFPTKQPNALNFLDSDSPTITPESIRRSMEEAAHRSPTSMQAQSPSSRSASTVLTDFKDDASDNVGDHETDRSTSPERGADVNNENHPPVNAAPRMKPAQTRRRSYGIPEVPREGSQHSHISQNNFTSRIPNPGPPPSLNLPRPDRVPLTGYQLLASRLSAAPDRADRFIRPMYRRFETLNHRLLLYLQDEISELEDQLHRLDAADTQNRRLPNCIFPASRRAECMAGGELHWHRTDILGKIGFKVDQYSEPPILTNPFRIILLTRVTS